MHITTAQARSVVRNANVKPVRVYNELTRSKRNPNSKRFVCFMFNNLQDAIAAEEALYAFALMQRAATPPKLNPSAFMRIPHFYVRVVCAA